MYFCNRHRVFRLNIRHNLRASSFIFARDSFHQRKRLSRVYIYIYIYAECGAIIHAYRSIFHFEREEHRDTIERSGLTCIFPIEESRWRVSWYAIVMISSSNGYRYIFSPDIDNPWISWPGDYYPGIRRIFRRDPIEKRGGTRLLHVRCSIHWYTTGQKFRVTDSFQELNEREREKEK